MCTYSIHVMDVIKCVIAAGCESHSSDVCLHVQVCPLEDNWHFTGKLRCFHWMTDHVKWRNCGRATCPAEKMKEVKGSELSTLCCEILSDKCWYHDPSCLTAWVHNFCRYQMRLGTYQLGQRWVGTSSSVLVGLSRFWFDLRSSGRQRLIFWQPLWSK